MMPQQRGVALISVLLVVALVTVIASGIMLRQQVSIRSTSNQLLVRQAWQMAQGGEVLAKAILRRDTLQAQRQTPQDHLGEPWAQVFPAFELETGQLRIRIEDAAGRFNLNSLVYQNQPNDQAHAQFRRLLMSLELDPSLADRLRDWQDEDQEAYGGDGAEDNHYLLQAPAYRTSGRALADASEVRLLLGMDEPQWRRLAPFVSALPAGTLLNVNTASAPVLASLADGLSLESMQALVLARGRTGFAELQQFLAQPALSGVNIESQGLAVSSDYFQLFCEVQIGERRQVLSSQLQRSVDGQVRVLSRDAGYSGTLPVSVEEPRT